MSMAAFDEDFYGVWLQIELPQIYLLRRTDNQEEPNILKELVSVKVNKALVQKIYADKIVW